MRQCPVCKQEFETGIIFCPTDGEKLISIERGEDDDPLIGELVDNKYLVQAKVARGGTAVVYRAMHVQLELVVALKVMHSHLTLDKTAVERFRREAFVAMYIRHPNAVAVLDFAITADGMVYVVTEFLSGVTLRDRVMEQHFFSLVEANEIMQQICAAVAVAHNRKVVHRDLKPDNIFLHQDQNQEVVKVLDFGIAKMNEEILTETSARLTRQGFVLGTPHYMSPEQCGDKEVDARTDIYSLGVVLYEMLTGRVPFNGRSYSSIVLKKTREKPKPTYEIREDIPPIVDAVIMHAMAKRAEDRPETVMMFARELEIAIRAVTEGEFQKVFQNASDQELDAAILLAGEPLRQTTGWIRGNSALSPMIDSALGKSDADTSAASESAATESSSAETARVAADESSVTGATVETARPAPPHENVLMKTATPTILDVPPSSHYDELLEFTDDAPKLLRQEMLQLAREMVMLLQIVIDDLDVDNGLDPVFFGELRASVDALRAVMFHQQHYYDQQQIKSESQQS